MFDLVIKNALVYDGAGDAPCLSDVAVRGDRIAALSPRIDGFARMELDAEGMALSPGFIDCHSHEDTLAISRPEVLPKITQGVTTVVVGNCGISTACAIRTDEVPDPMNLLGMKAGCAYPDIASYGAAVDAAVPSVNVAALVGHITLRNNVMDDLFRTANEREIRAMKTQLRQALAEGALGLSSGLAYASAFQSEPEEVAALAGELVPVNGLYTTHLRSEFEPILEAMDEAFAVARRFHIPVQISHFKCAGKANWGRTRETLRHLEQAAQSLDVGCDCYPYSASSATLDPRQITDEFDIIITWSDPHPEMAGKTLQDAAGEWGLSLEDAGAKLMPAGAIYHNMDPTDVMHVLRHPLTHVSSDGLPHDPKPHPRLWGAFPRVLGHYCRELGLFPLEEAIHKMTGKTAERFGITERGFIREGYFADLALFDPQTVRERADFLNPTLPTQGIAAVIVNGVLTYAGETMTGKRAGRFLRRR